MRPFLSALVVAATCWCMMSARAFTIVPADDESGQIVVIVERDFGDVVPLSALPKPYDSIIQQSQGPATLSFRWRYFRSDEDGLCFIRVDPKGNGAVSFGFYDVDPSPGDKLGAAAILIDENGVAMHSLLARADIEMTSGDATGRAYHAELTLKRSLKWWRRVKSIAFLTMKYYRQQTPDSQGVWDAMERAVERLSGGHGSSQRAMAR